MQYGTIPDEQLLGAHVARRDEAAFAELVRRHVNLVFGTAFRVLGDASAAEEVAQNVFVTLARKAASIRAGGGLAGWLHRAAILEARLRRRTDLRRRNREDVAARLGTAMSAAETPDSLPFEILDDALLELVEKDRQALLLRYFENRPFRDIARSLGVGEDAAQKRASRALGSLAAILRRRGAATTTAMLAARTLEAAASATAPARLATTITATAVGLSTPALGLLVAKVVTCSKIQIAVACLLLAAAPVGYQWHAAARLRRAAAGTARELAVTSEALARAEAAEAAARRRLDVLTRRLADTRSLLRRAGDQVATAALRPDASLYLWSDTATHVRIPKSIASRLRFSGTIAVPTWPGASPNRRAHEAVGADGSLAEPLAEALGLTAAEAEAIRQAFGRTDAILREQLQGVAYLTNWAPAQFRSDGKPAATLVTPALPDQGVALQDQLRGSLDRILGAERAGLVWQQAASVFNDTFNQFGALERFQTAVLEGPRNLALWDATRDPGGEIAITRNASGSLGLDVFPNRLQPIVAGWLVHSEPHRP